jgi:hypothetical protein
MTQTAKSDTFIWQAGVWQARADQAKRLANMLSRHDAELLLAYASECEGRSRAALKGPDPKPNADRVGRPRPLGTLVRRGRAA